MNHRVRKLFSGLWDDRRGVTAVITALGAVMLMGFAGLAIDLVSWEVAQHKLQSAADAAALAASMAASWGNQTITQAADAVTAGYGYVNGQNGVTVNATQNGDSAPVEVSISQTQPQYFTRLFLKTAPTIEVSAAAYPPGSPSGTMCVMSLADQGKLDVGSVTFSGNTDVTLNHCDLYNDSQDTDSTDFSGNSLLSVRNIFLVGGYNESNNAQICTDNSNLNGGTCTQPWPVATPVEYTDDPYCRDSTRCLSVTATGSVPNESITITDPWASNTPVSTSGCNQTNYSPPTSATLDAGSATTTPGIYVLCGNVTLNSGVTLSLKKGTYVIVNGNLTVNGGATLTSFADSSTVYEGVTIILVSTDTTTNYGITFNGSSAETLFAPASGASSGVPGIALWVDKNMAVGIDKFNGSSGMVINGVMYMPSQEVSYNGTNTATQDNQIGCSQLIGWTVGFTGNAYFTHDDCSAENIPVRDPSKPPVLTN